MGVFRKFAFALAAPLIATGCIWSPGKFNSELAVRKDGTFTLDYKGEILFVMPDDSPKAESWSDDMAFCYEGGAKIRELEPPFIEDPAVTDVEVDGKKVRKCTAADIARVKAEFDKKQADRLASKRRENEEMAKVFGLPGSDDASARKFAASVMKYKGWRSVTYKGKGVYDVDYHLQGRLDQDFLWPAMPDTDLIVPFIAIRRRTDGSVFVTAPAFAGGDGPFGARAKMMGLPSKGESGEKMRAEGRFTVVTNGEVLTNNSEDGPRPHAGGRALTWDVTPASAKTPETLIRL